jgi:hypothetical protein
MALLRALPVLLAAALLLASCSTPPPPRVTTRTVIKINTALLLASEDGSLSAEQLQARRDEVVRYLTERGLLAPEEMLVSNAAAADRIIRVAIAAGGGFKVTIFNPGSTGGYYSSGPDDVRVRVAVDDYWSAYDPMFDQGYSYSPYPAPGYYRYHPRDYLRPHYPRDYLAPVEPRRPPPPPVLHDPTPQPHPRHPGRPHEPHPRARDRNPEDGRPDWRDRHPPGRPDHDNHGGRNHDVGPRPPAPQPEPSPPVVAPERPEPRPTVEPQLRPDPPRAARDQDGRDDSRPAK